MNSEVPEELIPHWAERRSDGNYLQRRAVLPTRDGRRNGNATVRSIDRVPGVGFVANCETDAGNKMRLSLREMRELFYPPEWIRAEPEPLKPGEWYANGSLLFTDGAVVMEAGSAAQAAQIAARWNAWPSLIQLLRDALPEIENEAEMRGEGIAGIDTPYHTVMGELVARFRAALLEAERVRDGR
jgi:hypothetical protein